MSHGRNRAALEEEKYVPLTPPPPHLPSTPLLRYYGGGAVTQNNPQNVAMPYPFVTAYLRGGTDGFALKGGDATQGTLTTVYDGPRPFVLPNGTNTQGRKYQPAKKQGAIILATGGDYSNSAMGCFYEGVM